MSADLPAVARVRAAGIRPGGAWGSALTSQEFAAVRGVGFEPVGQVFGAAVYAVGYARGYGCPGERGSSTLVDPSLRRLRIARDVKLCARFGEFESRVEI